MANPKEVAGRAAADLVEDGMSLGLGTGSTVLFVLQRLAERLAEGLSIRGGVPTSLDTERKCRELSIPLLTLEDVAGLDLAIDGADEIDGAFRMIKGGGGALLREKVVASIARRVAIVVGPEKVVERLGKAFPLPIEFVPFARATVSRALQALGASPALRTQAPGEVFVTDNGNHILDCSFERGIADPEAFERAALAIPGVVECGLFLDLAHVLVIGHADGRAEVRERP